MPNIFVYDTEATGLEKAYDTPFQFGACVFDAASKLISETNLRGRLPRHVLPSPAALAVTEQSISQIQSSPLSHYDFVARVHTDIVSNAPSIMVSYNGLTYDDEILRHTFFSNLRYPYVTQSPGNERLDVLKVLHATAACMPNAVTLPINAKGKRSFKLEHVAPANGFQDHNAHDATGDVRATIFLAQKIRSDAPEVWSACKSARIKENACRMLSGGRPLVTIDWNYIGDKPTIRVVLPVAVDNTNPNEWLCVNLNCDVDRLLMKDVNSLKAAFRSIKGTKAIVPVKANSMPLLFELDDPALVNLSLAFDTANIAKIQSSADFADRLKAASDLKKSEYAQPENAKEMLYSGGFFPTRDDARLLDRFHEAEPHSKYELASHLTDPRARELSKWLIGSEWPEVLPAGERSAFEDELRQHLMLDEAKWTTVPSALVEIQQLRADPATTQHDILDEYEAYLTRLAAQWMPHAAE